MTIDIKAEWTNLNSRQRMLVIIAIGTVFFGAIYFITSAQFVDQPDIAQNSVPNKNAAQAPPVMPQGYQPDSTLRDPFAVASAYQKVAGPPTGTLAKDIGTKPDSSGPANSQAIAGKEEKPVLTGVVDGNGKRLAIIEYKSESRFYKAQDYVGPYQLLAVYEDSVTLWGPGGNLALTLGR